MSTGLPVDVSRETREGLEAFAAHLLRWTKAVNLIAPRTAADVWERHIVDSLQLWPLRKPGAKVWADLGSGGGLPAIPLAIVAKEQEPGLRFALVESDTRKAAFLADTIRRFALNAEVMAARIETLAPLGADIVSARAVAPLPKLLDLATRHAGPEAELMLMKGRRVTSELTEAQRYWSIRYEAVSSRTDPEANILIIREFHRLP